MIAICCDQKFRVDFSCFSCVLAVDVFENGGELFLVTLTGLEREGEKGKRKKGVEGKKERKGGDFFHY